MSVPIPAALYTLSRSRGFVHVTPVERSCERWRVEAYSPAADVRIIACHPISPDAALASLTSILDALPIRERRKL